MSEDYNHLSNRMAVVENTLGFMTSTLGEIKIVLSSIDAHIKASIRTDEEVKTLKDEVLSLKSEVTVLKQLKWKFMGAATAVATAISLLSSQFFTSLFK